MFNIKCMLSGPRINLVTLLVAGVGTICGVMFRFASSSVDQDKEREKFGKSGPSCCPVPPPRMESNFCGTFERLKH